MTDTLPGTWHYTCYNGCSWWLFECYINLWFLMFALLAGACQSEKKNEEKVNNVTRQPNGMEVCSITSVEFVPKMFKLNLIRIKYRLWDILWNSWSVIFENISVRKDKQNQIRQMSGLLLQIKDSYRAVTTSATGGHWLSWNFII